MTTENDPAASPAPKTEKITFTEKEEKVLQVAWHCLKSGAPDIDMKKLTELAGFNTEKTCSNTWGVIKKKLGVAPATPKKAAAGGSAKGKRIKEDVDIGDEAGDGETESPAKKRKTPKKAAVKAEAKIEDEDEDGAVFD